MTSYQFVSTTETITTSASKFKLHPSDGSAVGSDTALTYNVDGSSVTVDQSFNSVSVVNQGTTDLIFSTEPGASSTLSSGADGAVLIPAGSSATKTGTIGRLQFIRAEGSGGALIVLEVL